MGDGRLPAPPVALLFAAACVVGACTGDGGDGPRAAGPPELEGEVQVITSLDRWSLLAVPRGGGTVEARSIRQPETVVWEGETELPPVEEIRLLDGPLLVLRAGDGRLLRYDPRADRLETATEGPAGTAWQSWDGYGVIRNDTGRVLEQVGAEGSWRYELSATPVWAAPVEGGDVAALVDAENERQLWLLSRGASEPAASAASDVDRPGLTTAWGRRLAFSSPDGLALVDVPSLSPAGTVELPAAPTVLAASPSSHELYAGLADPSALYRVSRFTGEATRMTRLPRPPRAVRPAVLGDFLLVDDGGDPLLVPLDGSAPERLPGTWRDDLPLGTPDGRVLLLADGELFLRSPGDERGTALAAPVGRWWAAVPWNPSPPRRVAATEAAPTEDGARPPPEDTARGTADTTPEAGDAVERPPIGFYAVVTAARDPDGVRRLLADLRRAGYPTEVQTHTDDAGRTWYRGLVGRYPSREEAEAAARQLRRERDLNVWITEVHTGSGREELPG